LSSPSLLRFGYAHSWKIKMPSRAKVDLSHFSLRLKDTLGHEALL